MPYIPEEDRHGPHIGGTSGELNFAITRLVNDYIMTRGLRYRVINDAIGALECAKLELYRRIAAPYENLKIRENGDVYSSEIITP